LNVGEDGAWVYYYDRFPIVYLGFDGESKFWETDVFGARALAVTEDHTLLVGDSEGPMRGVLGRLGHHALEGLRTIGLDAPCHGGAPERVLNVVGRGPLIHLFTETRWYRLDLHQLV
jgi:hypothetical protein